MFTKPTGDFEKDIKSLETKIIEEGQDRYGADFPKYKGDRVRYFLLGLEVAVTIFRKANVFVNPNELFKP